MDDGDINAGHNDENLDQQWEAFLGEHSEDLADVAQSSTSRKFARKAQRIDRNQEKQQAKRAKVEQQFTVGDFNDDIFVQARTRTYGPRDHTGISWIDDVDDTFTPPNPQLGPMRKSTLLIVVLLGIGIACLVGAILIPSLSGMLGIIGGLCTLLGAAGFISQHRGLNQTRRDADDDGARV